MKLLIASDIHGDIVAAKSVADAYVTSGADRLVLLGLILNPLAYARYSARQDRLAPFRGTS